MEGIEGPVAPPAAEVAMVEPAVVRQIRELAARGWGSKRVARELGVALNTVRRYLRPGVEAGVQVRPAARRLTAEQAATAMAWFEGEAETNAVVVRDLLRSGGVAVSARTVQRLVEDRRRARRAAELATVRFETAPGQQMQIDFGQKRVQITGAWVRIYLLVAVLSYSRRLFVKAFLAERGDDWREGIAAAFEHFGGVPAMVLGDNARALVVARDRAARTVTFHPTYLAFCHDWGTAPRACAPCRAQTKGKGESGVKYVKRNALAGRSFESFGALEAHLSAWMIEADQREHGTTHEVPIERFERDERAALRPLPARPLPRREQRLRRRVAQDAFVDVETIRYSVPHRLVRDHVEVAVGDLEVRIFHGTDLVALHARSFEPYARVVDPAHFAGLWRLRAEPEAEPAIEGGTLAHLGRSLADYAAVIEVAR